MALSQVLAPNARTWLSASKMPKTITCHFVKRRPARIRDVLVKIHGVFFTHVIGCVFWQKYAAKRRHVHIPQHIMYPYGVYSHTQPWVTSDVVLMHQNYMCKKKSEPSLTDTRM